MADKPSQKAKVRLGEDWWAVIVAGLLMLAAALGWLGKSGLNIKF